MKYSTEEEYYMFEFLPLAIEYGMTDEMFWFWNEDYFLVYQKAYFNRISRENWINGLYISDAIYEVCTTIMPVLCYNGFSGFKPKDIKPIPYKSKPIDFLNTKEEKASEITEMDKEKKYRDRLNYWI